LQGRPTAAKKSLLALITLAVLWGPGSGFKTLIPAPLFAMLFGTRPSPCWAFQGVELRRIGVSPAVCPKLPLPALKLR